MISDQPDAREGQAAGAERFAVPLKPGKRRGGKGPQLFKTDAKNGQAVSIDLEKRLSGRDRWFDRRVPETTARRVAAAIVIVLVALHGRC